METFSSVHTIIKIVAQFGVLGIVIVMWWMDSKSIRTILNQYKSDMIEMRQMYKNNVHLVESNELLSGDLKEIIILNTQAMTTLAGKIDSNQFCPQVRLEKKAQGVLEG